MALLVDKLSSVLANVMGMRIVTHSPYILKRQGLWRSIESKALISFIRGSTGDFFSTMLYDILTISLTGV